VGVELRLSVRPAVVVSLALIVSQMPAAPAAPAHAARAKAAPSAAPVKQAPNSAAMSQAMNGYLNRLRGKLQSFWLMSDGDNRVVVTIDVAPDGAVNGVKAESTPKCEPAEQSASDSVSKSEPFEALPSGLNQGAIVILTFVSKVDPHGDSTSNILTRMDPHQPPKPATANGAPADSK